MKIILVLLIVSSGLTFSLLTFAKPATQLTNTTITQHGSWNRSVLSGYKVIFVPFHDGIPKCPPEDFLTGFTADLEKSTVHGRPVGIAVMKDGSMLISDDVSNTIWRVQAK
jgi:glucose/arabinose dehydrogenase